MVKEIELTKGQIAIIDNEDFDLVSQFKWRAQQNHNTWYAVSSHDPNQYMHRMILSCPRGSIVDHINKDGLDNRRCNLRIASLAENRFNARLSKNNTSGFTGVCFEKRTGKWVASVSTRAFGENRRIHIGMFWSKEEAASARDAFLLEKLGVSVGLNFPVHMPQ